MKRLLITIISAFSFVAASSQTLTYDGIAYEVVTGGLSPACEVTIQRENPYDGDITIPSTVRQNGITYEVVAVGDNAFYNCTSLTSVKLPATVVRIGNHAFNGCVSLTSVESGSRLEEIGDYAFYNCNQLEKICLSETLYKIGSYAFFLCKSLKFDCLTGTSLEIGENAFYGCSSLKNLKFDNVAEIGKGAFTYCTGLETLFFEQPVKNIRERAFQNDNAITRVSCSSRQPAFLSKNAFDEEVYKNATLIVPTGSRLLYIQLPPWSEFVNVEGSDIVKVESIPESESGIKVFQNGDRLIVEGEPGYLMIADIEGKIVHSALKEAGSSEINGLKQGFYIVSLGNETVKFLMK